MVTTSQRGSVRTRSDWNQHNRTLALKSLHSKLAHRAASKRPEMDRNVCHYSAETISGCRRRLILVYIHIKKEEEEK